MDNKSKITPLPFYLYFWPVAIITSLGFLASFYLSISHYRVYVDISYESFCTISRSINCDTVSQSPYAVVWGVPLAVWGMLGYLFFLLLLYGAHRHKQSGTIWSALCLISFCFSIHSLVLAYISSYLIKSYCIVCVVTYAVNFILLFYTSLIYRRFGRGSIIHGIQADIRYFWDKKARSGLYVTAFIGVAAVLSFFYPRYWIVEPPVIGNTVSTGLTEDGHPWIGAVHPALIITEFADYQCYQCRKMHYFLRRILTKNPDKLRIVHRHFPMDHRVNPIVKKPFHVGSGKLALIAIHAMQAGRFWEMSDQLFSLDLTQGRISFHELAGKTGLKAEELANCVNDPELHQKLWVDIREGIRMGMTGTPGYVIEGKLHAGYIPPEIIERALE